MNLAEASNSQQYHQISVLLILQSPYPQGIDLTNAHCKFP